MLDEDGDASIHWHDDVPHPDANVPMLDEGAVVGTFDELAVGDTFITPTRTLTDDDVDVLVTRGGYTHPLFTDPAVAAASPFGRRPLPGQAVLLLMGGLVEQTDRFDETTVALLGLRDVRFRAPAFPGDTVVVRVEIVAKTPTEDGARGVLDMAWTCRNGDDRAVVEATASMLFRRDDPTGGSHP